MQNCNLVELAEKICWARNTGQHYFNLFNILYDSTRLHGNRLIELDSSECQVVGLAFAYAALEIYFTDANGQKDRDGNSVSAENAFYCIGRSFMDKKNTFAMPALFTILKEDKVLLFDKIREYHLNNGMFSMGLLDQIQTHPNICTRDMMYYILSTFYDIDNRKFTIPTDLPYLIPSSIEVQQFLDEDHYNMEHGEELFKGVYNECKKTLINF